MDEVVRKKLSRKKKRQDYISLVPIYVFIVF